MNRKHSKQLYAITAIAVIFIIISHWIPRDNIINASPNGVIGVSILFVLSGYMLTKLLLEKRIEAEALSLNKLRIIKDFYLLCLLRTFPVYYITILLLFIFYQTPEVSRSAYIYFATFTSNFYFYKIQTWGGIFSHLWILAAAAQFFLFWPWIILFTNKKYVVHVIILFVGAGIVSQIAFSNIRLGNVLPFTCFDSFALGALLAWTTVYKMHQKKFLNRLFLSAIPALILFIISIRKPEWIFIPTRALISIIILCTITYIVYNEKNIFSFILNNKILVFLGTIGYGFFYYHNILPPFTWNIIAYFNSFLPPPISKYMGYVIFFENFIILILVSWLSWIIIEKPFMHIRKFFNYRDEFHTAAAVKIH